MKKNQTLVHKLCSPYCHYYKPGRNEGLLCRGAIVVKRRMQEGRSITPEKPGAQPDAATIELIVKKMCLACDFHEHDCDFMENRHVPACGGFVLLSKLIMSGQIVIGDIT
ncbi:MAG TPA: hypothetical protein VEI57_10110 [Nitrospirota bacterium]|nr:hypothetical protein [Nitrospirota bacterium]